MPVRRLSHASSMANESSSNRVTISALRLFVTAGESSDGAVGSSTTISASGFDMGLSRNDAKDPDSLSARRGSQDAKTILGDIPYRGFPLKGDRDLRGVSPHAPLNR